MSAEPQLKLEYFERALRRSPGGGALADAFQTHIEEVVGLINKNRRVAVVWQRYQGPAFMRAVMQNRVSQDVVIPKQVNSIPLEMLLLQMADALQRHGSPELCRMIAERSFQILRWARECHSFADMLNDLETQHTHPDQAYG
jgi:hypothetical protein